MLCCPTRLQCPLDRDQDSEPVTEKKTEATQAKPCMLQKQQQKNRMAGLVHMTCKTKDSKNNQELRRFKQ